MSATSSAGAPRPLHRGAGRAQVPGSGRGAPTRARAAETRWYPSYDEAPRSGGRGGPGGPGGPTDPGGPGGGSGGPGRRRGPRWKRIGLVTGVVVLALALLGGVGGWLYARNLDGDLARTDPFSEITGGRPAKQVDGAFNILLVGSDSRDPDAPVDGAGKWRADTVIVMHIPADHKSAYLVSIPRDLYVPIPEKADASCDSGSRNKINAAFAFGGLPLAVRTVECFTDVRIDHVMAIDFAGFKDVTDALGGVDLKVDRTIKSIHKPYRTFTKGVNHMDGAEALDWVRQRKQFPDGDFARMRHQQEFLKALLDKAASTGTLSNPKKLNDFLRALTAAVTVDQGFSLTDMAVQFRSLRGENLTFVTSPNLGGQTIDGQSVVVSDREKALAMYQAIAGDRMADWVGANQKGSGDSAGG
ncbi:LCP family protein [Micromonospora sp. WMMD998]|uniref:LCP family protein n=1 Tax=Micromonospora sp. WMMD998 TaxID=3016092 RepID=UPI002499BD5D|nr:LCP family protein [Micromonospora sp. WMMD998]WFE37514.1 LCP family protein [Micromonospora sp. WMMD998]